MIRFFISAALVAIYVPPLGAVQDLDLGKPFIGDTIVSVYDAIPPPFPIMAPKVLIFKPFSSVSPTSWRERGSTSLALSTEGSLDRNSPDGVTAAVLRGLSG